jgi:hypothetical protein
MSVTKDESYETLRDGPCYVKQLINPHGIDCLDYNTEKKYEVNEKHKEKPEEKYEEKPEEKLTDYSDNQEDDIISMLDPLSFTNNSDLYVVSLDEVPRFYVKDEMTASKKMWDLARTLLSHDMCDGYDTYFVHVTDTELHILGKYRFFLVMYDQTLHRISYTKVVECV